MLRKKALWALKRYLKSAFDNFEAKEKQNLEFEKEANIYAEFIKIYFKNSIKDFVLVRSNVKENDLIHFIASQITGGAKKPIKREEVSEQGRQSVYVYNRAF